MWPRGGLLGPQRGPLPKASGAPDPRPSPRAPKPRRLVPGGGGETAGPHAGHRWLRAGPERWHKAQARGTARPSVDLCCEAKKRLPCLPAAHGPRFPGCRCQLLGSPGQPRPGRGPASSSLRGRSGPYLLPQGTPSSPKAPELGCRGPRGLSSTRRARKPCSPLPVTPGQE